MKVLHLLGAAGVVALALALGFLGLLWWSQERIVWQPPGGALAEDADARVRRVNYRADDGQPLFAYVVTPEGRAARGVVLSFHGNAELARWTVPWAEEVARRTGWAVVLPEYRGYAGLPGRPSYQGSGLDARAALQAARQSLGGEAAGGPAPASAPPLVLHGYSLGSAVAAELADEARPAAIVLAAPFTSARDMARSFLPGPAIGVWPLVGRVRFDTQARVAAAGAPVWVGHGTADRVIPARMGEAVFRAAREKGELLLVGGAGHGDLVMVGGERYWAWLGRALGGAERR